MSEGNFKQFTRKQLDELEEAEVMARVVEERWGGRVEVIRLAKKIEKAFEGEEARRGVLTHDSIQREILPKIPSIPPSLLEETLQEVVRRYTRREHYNPRDFGRLLSALINKTVAEYVESEKKKGKKPEDIEPLEIHLNVSGVPRSINDLGYQNQKYSHLFIEGDVGLGLGSEILGGKIVLTGNAGDWLGGEMSEGEILVKGNAGGLVGALMYGGEIVLDGSAGDWLGEDMSGGKITVLGNVGDGLGKGMSGGKIVAKGKAGKLFGLEMSGGIVVIEGDVESFSKEAFRPSNKGTIYYKGVKIWENGQFTREGKKMKEEGKLVIATSF